MNKTIVQDKGYCWICFSKENHVTLTTEDSERTLRSCETYLDISIIIKRFEKKNQVSYCSCCYESTRQLISLEEQVEKLRKEISDVSSVFSKNVLERRSRLQNEINISSTSVLPTEKCVNINDYDDRHSFERIENGTMKEEVIETAPKVLPADSQGNTKINDCIFSDPWFEIYENDNVNYEKCETAVYSEDAIDVKYSYDEIKSGEVDNPDREVVTHQELLETNAKENEQAKTTIMTSAVDCTNSLKMPHRCSVCEKSFQMAHQLKRHEISHSGKRPYKCSFCSHTFRYSCEAKRHETIHTGERLERPYKCSFCSKGFYRSNAAKEHEMIHTGERPYKCSFCSKGFYRSNAAKEHEMIHTGERPHKCSICEKTFIQRSNLIGHYLRMHGNVDNKEKFLKLKLKS